MYFRCVVSDLIKITGQARQQSTFPDSSFPKITTHYTVCPRDNDPRWKG